MHGGNFRIVENHTKIKTTITTLSELYEYNYLIGQFIRKFVPTKVTRQGCCMQDFGSGGRIGQIKNVGGAKSSEL